LISRSAPPPVEAIPAAVSHAFADRRLAAAGQTLDVQFPGQFEQPGAREGVENIRAFGHAAPVLTYSDRSITASRVIVKPDPGLYVGAILSCAGMEVQGVETDAAVVQEANVA